MPDQGLTSIASHHSVDDTVAKIEAILHEKNIKIFTIIDHSGEAKLAGLEMHPTKVVIFGNPKGGTPLMLAAPSVAIDLPLKLLVWEDGEGYFNACPVETDEPVGLGRTTSEALRQVEEGLAWSFENGWPPAPDWDEPSLGQFRLSIRPQYPTDDGRPFP